MSKGIGFGPGYLGKISGRDAFDSRDATGSKTGLELDALIEYGLDHFCGDCGGYLGTTNTHQDAADDLYRQQALLYFQGLGQWRLPPHLPGCPVVTDYKRSMSSHVMGRHLSELPDSVAVEDVHFVGSLSRSKFNNRR